MTTTRRLPSSIIRLLCGEFNAPSEWSALTALGRDYYRDGKAGKTYAPVEGHGFPCHVVATVDRFLRSCWEQGQRAAGVMAVTQTQTERSTAQ